MKYLLILAVVVFASCAKKKDYRCVCENVYNQEEAYNQLVIAESVSEAGDQCDAKESSGVICQIKP